MYFLRQPRFAGARQADREGGAVSERAVDREPALVARQDMLDDGEAEAGSALGAALRHIDAVEPFGQPRQVLGRDAGPEIADADSGLRVPAGCRLAPEGDLDPLAGRAVFQRVLHKILEDAHEL